MGNGTISPRDSNYRQGYVSQESGYAHLIIEVNFDSIFHTLKQMRGIANSMMNSGNFQGNARLLKTRQINTILRKFNQLTYMATPLGGTPSSVFGFEQVDLPLPNKVKDLPKGDQTWGNYLMVRDPSTFRKKRAAWVAALASMVVPPLVSSLSAFGLSRFNNHKMQQIISSVNNQETNIQALAVKVNEDSLRIDKLRAAVNATYHLMTIRKKVDAQKKYYNRFIYEFNTLNVQFQLDFLEFYSGMIMLRQHRLSPLLINPTQLHTAFQELKDVLSEQQYLPIYDDPNLVFESEASVFSVKYKATEESKFLIVVHVPIQRDTPFLLYKYIERPIILDNSLSLKVTTPYAYLAISADKKLAFQVKQEDIAKCKAFTTQAGEIIKQFHCPDQAIIARKPRDLCLYNLFTEENSLVNQTCQVVVDRTAEHSVVKISGSQFQIFSKGPKTFYWICNPTSKNRISRAESKNVTAGMYFFNLTAECPYAYTEDYKFILNKNIKFLKKIDLDSSTADNSYLKTLVEKLNPTHVQETVEPLLLNDNIKPGVPLELVQNKLIEKQNPFEVFYKSLGYISLAISIIVLLCFSALCIKNVCYDNSLCNCKQSAEDREEYECDNYGLNCKESDALHSSHSPYVTPSLNSIIKSSSRPPRNDYIPTWAVD